MLLHLLTTGIGTHVCSGRRAQAHRARKALDGPIRFTEPHCDDRSARLHDETRLISLRAGMMTLSIGQRWYCESGRIATAHCVSPSAMLHSVSGSLSLPSHRALPSLELPNNRMIWPVHRIIARFLKGPEDNVYHYGALVVDLSKRPSGNSEK